MYTTQQPKHLVHTLGTRTIASLYYIRHTHTSVHSDKNVHKSKRVHRQVHTVTTYTQQVYKGVHIDNNSVHIYNHIDRLNTESHQQCAQVKTYTTNNNYGTVSNNMYSSRGPVGTPLYPQLSGPCNRPFPRDSRVFTRRLTPNMVCSRSHTKVNNKVTTIEQSQYTTVTRHKVTTIQGHMVHHGHKPTHYKGVYKVYTNYTRVHTDTREYTSTRQGRPRVQST